MGNDTNVNIGNSGEYFVAGELERRGYTVAVPMSNVKDFDLLAIERDTHRQIAIQVKTTGYKQKKWTLSKKNETLLRQAMELLDYDMTLVKSMRQAPTTANYTKNAYSADMILPSGGFDMKR